MPTPSKFYNYESRVSHHSYPARANKEVEKIKYMEDSIVGIHILQNKARHKINNYFFHTI
jgi:hypothetical protein